ncbi:hypothetical protein PUN4_60126 [Paraburkholderia unamae]|nr:hypothetical protein PUN4_60126 [Paraburkholderia unamae]
MIEAGEGFLFTGSLPRPAGRSRLRGLRRRRRHAVQYLPARAALGLRVLAFVHALARRSALREHERAEHPQRVAPCGSLCTSRCISFRSALHLIPPSCAPIAIAHALLVII